MMGLITAEQLMDYSDYTIWTNQQQQTSSSSATGDQQTGSASAGGGGSAVMDEEEFSHSSLKSWTVLLAQLMKVSQPLIQQTSCWSMLILEIYIPTAGPVYTYTHRLLRKCAVTIAVMMLV